MDRSIDTLIQSGKQIGRRPDGATVACHAMLLALVDEEGETKAPGTPLAEVAEEVERESMGRERGGTASGT